MEGDIINERNVCTWKKSQISLKIKHKAVLGTSDCYFIFPSRALTANCLLLTRQAGVMVGWAPHTHLPAPHPVLPSICTDTQAGGRAEDLRLSLRPQLTYPSLKSLGFSELYWISPRTQATRVPTSLPPLKSCLKTQCLDFGTRPPTSASLLACSRYWRRKA